jgi:hypothetical protein
MIAKKIGLPFYMIVLLKFNLSIISYMLRHLLLFVSMIFLADYYSIAQTIKRATIVRGIVIDSTTNEPLSFVSITFSTSLTSGTVTNNDGMFKIVSYDAVKALRVSSLGYETALFPIQQGKNQYVKIKLRPNFQLLNAVVIQGKRKRYKNKGNPAVELIQKVIENKSKNRPESSDYLQYQRYQKIVFSFNNVKDALTNNRLLQPFRFIFENVDTTIVPGRKLIPVFLKETLSDFYFRKNPYATKEIIDGEKIVRFDEYINRRSVSASVNYLYQEINIYDNNINFLTNQFLSPIASLAPTFYKYFIKDTSNIEGVKCVKLSFKPRNKTDLLFQGDMYITLDSTYAVKKIDMTVNKAINLNWVRSVSIVQDFEKTDPIGWRLSTDNIGGDFGITQGSIGIYGQRVCQYHNYKVDVPANDSVYRGLSQVYAPGAEDKNEEYWQAHRHPPLRPSEHNIYTLMDSLKHMRQFKNDMRVLNTFSADFIKAGWVEFGPFSTFYSYNPIEGSRVKFGGRTTPLFSKKINFDGYFAYGAKDESFKSSLGATYSLTPKTIYQFPVKSIRASYKNDIEIPGQELAFAQTDNALLSIKRGTNDKMYYNLTYRLEHLNEFANHFSYNIAYEFSHRTSAGNLYFNNNNYAQYINTTDHIDVSKVSLMLRYAPHERFFQGSLYRTPFANKYPVFQVQYSAASKVIGSNYDFQTLNLNISKRFYLSVLGYTDVSLEAGKVFGQVPYLLLDIHRANQTYSYQALSYNLMNFLEFVSDEYASINIDHCFNGFFFNKIPLFKKLNFRELVTFKALYGGLSNTNNPAYHPDLFKFPTNSLGVPLTYTLEKMPYMEAGVGVSNIFRFLRVEYVQRLTYLNHPGISKSGIRLGLKFDF